MLTAPYGTWPSPISAADVARSAAGYSFAIVSAGAVWWQEARPDEGGRTTIVRDGAELLPAPWSARTRVHEYGGRSYLPVPGRGFTFSNHSDQRLYLADGDGDRPEPLTPETGGRARYADTVLSADAAEIWCVRELHGERGVSRAIVAVPLDGSGEIRELVTGADFFAFPTPSPDGSRLAWISWNHPRMPWDGTELYVADLADLGAATPVMGGEAESVLSPAWRDNESLYVISDSSGWWNPYLVPAADGEPRPLCPRDEEFDQPLWQLGGRSQAVLADGTLAVVHGRAEQRLGVLDPETGELRDLDLPYSVFSRSGVSASGGTLATIGGGPAEAWTVFTVTPAAPGSPSRALREGGAPVTDRAYLPVPVPLSEGPNGAVVHALVYPPASPDAVAPAGELPPFIVWVHGGPTDQVMPVLDMTKAFFTSRGIGVIDVNYGGSTGFGRRYRERLRGEWGVVDVADSIAAVRALVASGQADPRRLGIRGGSAGGWTALAAVTTAVIGADPVFAAAVSYYGVTDLRPFAETTHDFESRYLDGLVGPLPASDELYAERSPLGHVTEATCPILVLQGLDDPVVPPALADIILGDLASHGIPHAYLAFEGESHGFRRTGTVTACLEAELSFYGRVMSFDPPGVPPISLV